jgi:hypothetical protein
MKLMMKPLGGNSMVEFDSATFKTKAYKDPSVVVEARQDKKNDAVIVDYKVELEKGYKSSYGNFKANFIVNFAGKGAPAPKVYKDRSLQSAKSQTISLDDIGSNGMEVHSIDVAIQYDFTSLDGSPKVTKDVLAISGPNSSISIGAGE